MTIDPTTGRIVGQVFPKLEKYYLISYRPSGGAEFAASFGPGRYSVFTCVDFKGDGYNFTSPTEYGSWLGNFPVRFTTNLQQVYFGKPEFLSSIKLFVSSKRTCLYRKVSYRNLELS